MFRLFLGNVQVRLFGAVPKEAFILASSLFPPRLLNPVCLLNSEFSSNKWAQRATGTSARAAEPEGPGEGGTAPSSWDCLLKPIGKCDRKEELRRGMKNSPPSQLFADANIPAVGAKAGHLSIQSGGQHGMGPQESESLLAGPPCSLSLDKHSWGQRKLGL